MPNNVQNVINNSLDFAMILEKLQPEQKFGLQTLYLDRPVKNKSFYFNKKY